MKKNKFTINQKRKILSQLKINNDLLSRAELFSKLGYSHKGGRDLYDALGWQKTLDINDFWGMYKRFGVAKRVVDIFPNGCWKYHPTISESDNEETEFEKEWSLLVKKKRIYHYLHRVDILSGIGRFGVLLLGFDDNLPLEEECVSASKLLYLQTYREGQVTIKQFDTDTKSERYGKPELYTVQISLEDVNTKGAIKTKTIDVHYSRIIHVAEGLLLNEVFGTPRLEPSWNDLYNLQMVVGSSGEMFWRGAFGGIVFERDAEGDYEDDQDEVALEDEIYKYLHGFQRHMNLQGVTVNSINQQIIAPQSHADTYIDLICATKSIPKRIFMGSEMGELSSSQDKENWNDVLSARNINYCEPMILRPFIDRLIEKGVLPEPIEEYIVSWRDLNAPSDTERNDNATKVIGGLSQYINGGVDSLISPEILLKKYYGYTQEEIDEVMENLTEFLTEKEIDEEQEEQGQQEEKSDSKFKRTKI